MHTCTWSKQACPGRRWLCHNLTTPETELAGDGEPGRSRTHNHLSEAAGDAGSFLLPPCTHHSTQRYRATKALIVNCSRQKHMPVLRQDYSPGHIIKERAGTHRHSYTETYGSTTGSIETLSDLDKSSQVRDFVELRCTEWRHGSQPVPRTPWTGEPALNCTGLLLQIGISTIISASCL